VKIVIRIESFAIIKYVVYPQTITYIIYCHAKLQLKVILGSLWVVVGRCRVVVGHCRVVVGRCGSLWVVPCSENPEYDLNSKWSSLQNTNRINLNTVT
jgi:hypothetical protein